MTDTTTTQPENSDVTPPAKRQSLCWKYLSASVVFFFAIDCLIYWLFRRADGDVPKDRSLKGITYHNYGNGLFRRKYENNNQLIQIRKW